MTVTCNLNLADQLTALAGLKSFDPSSYAVNSRGAFSKEYVDGGSLRELVPMLRRAGIEPSDGAAFDRLVALDLPRPAALQGRRLDLTPEAYLERSREAAAYAAFRLEAGRHIALERDVLRRELADSMRAECEDYVTALRPAFDSAIADFRQLADLGLGVGSTAEDAIQLGADAPDVWMRATTGASSARTLAAIAGIRIKMSVGLGLQPVNTEPYAGGPIRYGICFGVGNEFDEHDGWRRWMAVAATGTASLRSIAEVTSILAERRRVWIEARAAGAAAGQLGPGLVDADGPGQRSDGRLLGGF